MENWVQVTIKFTNLIMIAPSPHYLKRKIVMMLQKFIESMGKKFGVVVVPDWRAVRLVEERHLARLLQYLKVDCVFDVGANVGQYGHMLREYVGYGGRIVSFEPNPAVLGQLEEAASCDPQWHVERIGLGSAAGMVEFHAYDLSELGSFRSFGASEHAPENTASKTITVPIQTLESYMVEARRRWCFKRPFLKLDTQGFDLEVAKGAGQALREFVGLQSEIAFQPIYDDAPDYLSALNFYQSAGFVISRLVPIHEIHFPQLVEMDVIMVRADLAKLPG
jgi:FkbM family methyltransferase